MSSHNPLIPSIENAPRLTLPYAAHTLERKLFAALPVATLWVFGMAVLFYLNTEF